MDFSFEERLNNVLDDRKQTPWGKSLGFTSASISHIFSGGRIPGPEFLQAIRRAENVNLNWLLTGEGSPYITEHFISGSELSEYLTNMLEDEPWRVYVCSHTEIACLLLTQPGQYEFKGKWIDYTIAHILVGPSDESLNEILELHDKVKNEVIVLDLVPPLAREIMVGNVGTYLLLDRSPSLLDSRPRLKLSEITFSASSHSDAKIDVSVMRAVVKLVDECEDKLDIELTSAQRARVITAVYRQAERLSLEEEDIQNAVETSLEVLRD